MRSGASQQKERDSKLKYMFKRPMRTQTEPGIFIQPPTETFRHVGTGPKKE